ncbi:MAG TPA: Hpt domain-containing protein [Nitrospira sp.]|nr:Hpt domain-containing protein [Nitrospira sp.]
MSQDHIFSLDHALALVDDDRELLRAMIELFVEHGLQDLAAIQAAVVSQNAAALAASAHRLKGALVQFGAPAAVEAVSALEALGKAGTLEVAGRGYDKLETELFRLLAVMRHLLGKGFIE